MASFGPSQQQQSEMGSSGPSQHPTTGFPAGLQQKTPKGKGRHKKTVNPSSGGSEGGHVSQGNTQNEAAFGFAGGIGVAQGADLFDSDMPTNRSQYVSTSVTETRVSHGEQSRKKIRKQIGYKRHWGVRKKPSGKWEAEIADPSNGAKVPLGTFDTQQEAIRAYEEAACRFRTSQVRQKDGNSHQPHHATGATESPHVGAVEPSNRTTDSPYNIDLISQEFPGFDLCVELLQNPDLSELPAIQRSLEMLLPNTSLQQPASSTAERIIPAVSATALQHSNYPTEPFSHVTEIDGGMQHNPSLSPIPISLPNPSLQQPTSGTVLFSPTERAPAISGSPLQYHIPTQPCNFTDLLLGIGDGFESESLYSDLPGSGAQEYLGPVNFLNSRSFSMEQNADPSSRFLIQPSLSNSLPNPSWQQPTSHRTVPVPRFSASTLQHPILTGLSPQSTEIFPGKCDGFESPSFYSNVPGSEVQEYRKPRLNLVESRSFSTEQNPSHSPLPLIQHYPAVSLPNPSLQQLTSPMVSASALQHHIPMEPSNQSYRNTFRVPTASASSLQHRNPTDPSNQSYTNPSRPRGWF